MCPERAVLSLYLDGELEQPWSERVESHLRDCTGCRERLRHFQDVSHALLEANEPDINAAQSLVWRRLELAIALARQPSPVHHPWWHRWIRVPATIALAAAAALTLLVTTVAFWANVGDIRGVPVSAVTGATEAHVAAPAAAPAAPIEDLERLLQSLDGNTPARRIIIQLPTESQFSMRGQPAILRESELAGSAR